MRRSPPVHQVLALPSRLLFIADASHAPDSADLVRTAVSAGVRFVEVRRARRPDGAPESASRLEEIARALAAAGPATVIVNDRVDLALLSGAAGVHVGQDDLPPEAARRLLGPRRLLGLSTRDERQVAAAQLQPLDYVAVGPVYESATKSGHAEPLGLERLAACCEASRLPVVAIGGVDGLNIAGVLDAGAAAACVAGAIARGDVAREASRLLEAIDAHRPIAPAERGAEPVLLAGPPGSGKSTVGRLLARRLDVPFHDLDAAVGGAEGAADLLERVGEHDFRRREAAELSRILGAADRSMRCVVSLGGGTPRGDRSRILIRRSAALVVDLVVPMGECVRRLVADPVPRPLLEAARARGQEALRDHFRAREGGLAGIAVDGMGESSEVVGRILDRLP